MTPHDEYDPELHGVPEQEPASAQRGMALAVTLLLVLVPLVALAMCAA